MLVQYSTSELLSLPFIFIFLVFIFTVVLLIIKLRIFAIYIFFAFITMPSPCSFSVLLSLAVSRIEQGLWPV